MKKNESVSQHSAGLPAHSPVVLDIAGLALSTADRRRLAHPLVGGLILFARNWQDRRQLTEQEWQRVSQARGRLSALHLAIDDRGAVRPVDIRSHARTLARRGPLAGVVVDYLQLMSGAHGDRRPRHEQVAEWSRMLKLLAKELQVPVIALSQLNRASEARSDRRPTMADLRESGAIEQDADVILLLHVDEEADATLMDVQVAKNRQGQTGALKLLRRGHVARLDNYEWRADLPDHATRASNDTRS